MDSRKNVWFPLDYLKKKIFDAPRDSKYQYSFVHLVINDKYVKFESHMYICR